MSIKSYAGSGLTQAGNQDLYRQFLQGQISQQQNNWRNIGIGFGGKPSVQSFEGPSLQSGATDGYYNFDTGKIQGLDTNSGIGGMTLGGVADISMGLMNAYNMFRQIGMQKEQLGMAREQLGMAKEQWGITKDEVSRIAKVRNNLNSGYATGNYGASPTSKTYS